MEYKGCNDVVDIDALTVGLTRRDTRQLVQGYAVWRANREQWGGGGPG